ncbi:MAG TPA: hypothetical protein VGC54_07770 [Planctomycetota bacterium]
MSGLLLVLLATACGGQEPVDGFAEPGDASDPVLHRRGEQLFLLWQAGGRAFERAWGTTAAAPRPAEAGPALRAAMSGRLEIEQLGALAGPAPSSPRLRNGVLWNAGRLLGFSPDWLADAGGVELVYDRAHAGEFDVIHRAADGAESRVASGPAFQAHAVLARDSAGRSWVAWDEGRTNWGRAAGLHRARRLHLAVRLEGRWQQVALPAEAALLGPPRGEGRPVLAELPRLAADEDGPLWLIWRVAVRWPDGDGQAAERVAWVLRAAALTESGWSPPQDLPDSDGPNQDTLAVAPLAGGGVALAYETDGRIARFPEAAPWATRLPARTRIRLAELHAAGGLPAPRSLLLEAAAAVEPAAPAADEGPAFWREAGSGSLVPAGSQLLLGDLHRHSDLSRCQMDSDGSPLDQFRYARGPGRLDFLALTDHHQHLDARRWRDSRETTANLDEPGHFVALFGFERALGTGHRNLLCIDPGLAEAAPFLPFDPQDPWRGFDPDDWIAIPHQLADRTAPLRWIGLEPRIQPVVEIFQGWRGSYEASGAFRQDLGAEDGFFANDRLLDGRRFGFLASSDHGSSSRAFAAVYAHGRDRKSIFEALRARRCFACTAPMRLEVRLGPLFMGQQGPADAAAALQVRVQAGGALARVEVVRGGALAHRWTGPDGEPELLFLRAGRSGEGRDIRVSCPDSVLGSAVPYNLEPADGDRLERDGDAVVLRAELHRNDEDGLVLPVQAGPDGGLEVQVDGQVRRLRLPVLRAEGPRRIDASRTRVEARLDPPALGGADFTGEWAPGDWRRGEWVYVRVVRIDGEMAWSSPIWID